MILLVSYDLNGRERPEAYEAVKKVITSNAISYKKPLYSQWFVETDDPPDVWSKRITDVADTDDNWFVCRVGLSRVKISGRTVESVLKENLNHG